MWMLAGEDSGDIIGANLMRSLKRVYRIDSLLLKGVGGPEMEKEGLQCLFHSAELSVMGLLPVFTKLPQLYLRYRQVCQAIAQDHPKVIFFIDYQEFNHCVARWVRKHHPEIKIVQVVAPSVWAWRPGRAKKMKHFIDHIFTIFPFESALFRKLGGPPCTYIGHPLILDSKHASKSPKRHNAQTNTDNPLVKHIMLLPGSRPSELSILLPIYAQVVNRLVSQDLGLQFSVITLHRYHNELVKLCSSWSAPIKVVSDPIEKARCFQLAHHAIVASGTATLELGLSCVPMIVTYKVSRLEAYILRKLVVSPYVALPNIILQEHAVPELLQERCEPKTIAAASKALLVDNTLYRNQQSTLMRLRSAISHGFKNDPICEPTDIIEKLLIQDVKKRKGDRRS